MATPSTAPPHSQCTSLNSAALTFLWPLSQNTDTYSQSLNITETLAFLLGTHKLSLPLTTLTAFDCSARSLSNSNSIEFCQLTCDSTRGRLLKRHTWLFAHRRRRWRLYFLIHIVQTLAQFRIRRG